MDAIKLATPEEVETIAAQADLLPGTMVLSFGPDKAVVRQAVEVDPVFCDNPKRKAYFMSHIETYLRLLGIPAFYFNVSAEDETWRNVLEHWGAEPTTGVPEIRYKKALL